MFTGQEGKIIKEIKGRKRILRDVRKVFVLLRQDGGPALRRYRIGKYNTFANALSVRIKTWPFLASSDSCLF